eukprot:6187862-Pleurochrysis_carterae.AAC.3
MEPPSTLEAHLLAAIPFGDAESDAVRAWALRNILRASTGCCLKVWASAALGMADSCAEGVQEKVCSAQYVECELRCVKQGCWTLTHTSGTITLAEEYASNDAMMDGLLNHLARGYVLHTAPISKVTEGQRMELVPLGSAGAACTDSGIAAGLPQHEDTAENITPQHEDSIAGESVAAAPSPQAVSSSDGHTPACASASDIAPACAPAAGSVVSAAGQP